VIAAGTTFGFNRAEFRQLPHKLDITQQSRSKNYNKYALALPQSGNRKNLRA
ncbi:uncharacterized protein METZ01_LOCUS185266, partial [marine metagenome]